MQHQTPQVRKEVQFLRRTDVRRSEVRGSDTVPFPGRALRVRKKMSGDRMPVKMIGDILTNQLPHMQPYIRSGRRSDSVSGRP